MSGILDLVPDLRRAGATAGGEYAGACPWCGGEDRFRVWPEHPSGRARWWCRQCNRHGDTIDLLRERDGLTYPQAATAAGKALSARSAPSRRRRREPPLSPPCAAWQCRAEEVTKAAEKALWAPCSARALAYLRGRGFTDDTIHIARLGYVVADLHEARVAWGLPSEDKPVWVPRGITIPWRACGSLWRLNVRRPAGEPKYIGPAGSKNGLYGADGLRPGRPVMLVEGELDALAVAQEAGDLVAAVATGSTCGGRHPQWVRRLAAAPIVLVAYDDDDAGEAAAGWWLKALPRARRLAPEGDPAAMLETGADLHVWVREALR